MELRSLPVEVLTTLLRMMKAVVRTLEELEGHMVSHMNWDEGN